MDKSNIILTGFMGTGKTVVGKKLASLLNMDFIDTDRVIEEREKDSVVRIFQVKGEPYFRNVEAEVIEDVSKKERCVIATGGGAVIRKQNLENLKRKGTVICLTAEPAVVLMRTSSARDRPLLLKSKDAIATIRLLLKERKPYYSEADYTVDTSAHTPDDTVAAILEILKKGKDDA